MADEVARGDCDDADLADAYADPRQDRARRREGRDAGERLGLRRVSDGKLKAWSTSALRSARDTMKGDVVAQTCSRQLADATGGDARRIADAAGTPNILRILCGALDRCLQGG